MDKVIIVKIVLFNEVLDLFGVVIGVDVECFVDVVGEVRGVEIEFDVEDVVIVGEGSEFVVFFDVDGVSFYGEIRVKFSFEVVSFLESKIFGNFLLGVDL